MPSCRLALALACAMALQSPAVAQSPDTRPVLKCDIGPLLRSYGNGDWFVYSCNDNKSLVLTAAPGNVAQPSYFIFSPENAGYHLRGEGNGNKAATQAAYDEISVFSYEGILQLIADTKKVGEGRPVPETRLN